MNETLLPGGQKASIEVNHILIHGSTDDETFEVPFPEPLEGGLVVANSQLAWLLAVYSPEGHVYCVDLDEQKCTRIIEKGHFNKNPIIWCTWHELSATGMHLAILTAGGLFYLINTSAPAGRAELRLRIKSPEDHSLRCASAVLQQEILWVGMENGDILAISPVLPFPCFIDPLRKSLRYTDLDESVEAVEAENFIAALQQETQDGVVMRNPRRYHLKTALTRGPFLLQPEPQYASGSIAFLVPFTFFDIDFLVTCSQSRTCLDIYMLERPITPAWRQQFSEEDHLEGGKTSSSCLTLLESIVVSERIQSATFDGAKGILIFGENSAKIALLDWIDDLVALLSPSVSEGDKLSPQSLDQIRFVSRLETLWTAPPTQKIVSKFVANYIIFILCSDGKTHVQMLENRGGARHLGKVLCRHPDFIKPLNTLPLPSSCVPREFGTIKLTIPKLSEKLKKAVFPADLDEDILEELAKIIYTWRSEIIARCNRLSEEFDYFCKAFGEISVKQKEWADRVMGQAEHFRGIVGSGSLEITQLEENSKSYSSRLSGMDPGLAQHQKVLHICQRIKVLNQNIRSLLSKTRNTNSGQAFELKEQLEYQRVILDQIQARIAQLCLSEKGERDDSERNSITLDSEIKGH